MTSYTETGVRRNVDAVLRLLGVFHDVLYGDWRKTPSSVHLYLSAHSGEFTSRQRDIIREGDIMFLIIDHYVLVVSNAFHGPVLQKTTRRPLAARLVNVCTLLDH